MKSPLPFFQKFKTSTELGSKSPKSPKSPGVRLKSPLKSRNTKSPDTDFELDLGEGRRTKEEGRRRETQPSFVDFLKKSTKKRERRRLVQSSQVVSGVSQELKAPYGPVFCFLFLFISFLFLFISFYFFSVFFVSFCFFCFLFFDLFFLLSLVFN